MSALSASRVNTTTLQHVVKSLNPLMQIFSNVAPSVIQMMVVYFLRCEGGMDRTCVIN